MRTIIISGLCIVPRLLRGSFCKISNKVIQFEQSYRIYSLCYMGALRVDPQNFT